MEYTCNPAYTNRTALRNKRCKMTYHVRKTNKSAWKCVWTNWDYPDACLSKHVLLWVVKFARENTEHTGRRVTTRTRSIDDLTSVFTLSQRPTLFEFLRIKSDAVGSRNRTSRPHCAVICAVEVKSSYRYRRPPVARDVNSWKNGRHTPYRWRRWFSGPGGTGKETQRDEGKNYTVAEPPLTDPRSRRPNGFDFRFEHEPAVFSAMTFVMSPALIGYAQSGYRSRRRLLWLSLQVISDFPVLEIMWKPLCFSGDVLVWLLLLLLL